MTKLSPRTLFLVLSALIAFSTFAGAQAGDQKTSVTGKTITGCLQKGVEPNGGFYLITANNQHLELYDAGSASLAEHVGQTVALTGSTPNRSAEQEKSSQPYEKQETGTRKHADFQVATLAVVSQSCQK